MPVIVPAPGSDATVTASGCNVVVSGVRRCPTRSDGTLAIIYQAASSPTVTGTDAITATIAAGGVGQLRVTQTDLYTY